MSPAEESFLAVFGEFEGDAECDDDFLWGLLNLFPNDKPSFDSLTSLELFVKTGEVERDEEYCRRRRRAVDSISFSRDCRGIGDREREDKEFRRFLVCFE